MPSLILPSQPASPRRFATCLAFVLAWLCAGPAVAADAATACTTGLAKPVAGRPAVGLVLSGGGARGAAHIGVLRAIERAGIPVDVVVGTSMGSIVGALYASGMPVDEIDRVVRETPWDEVLDDGPPYVELAIARKRELGEFQLGGRIGIGADGIRLPAGVRQGQNVQLMLRRLMEPVAGIDCFRDFGVPFAAVATDAETGVPVVLDRGDIVSALRASMAIPAFLTPVERDGRLLVDGGTSDNMPISIARSMGADIVIAVDIATPLAARDKLKNLVGMSLQMSTLLTQHGAELERRLVGDRDVLIVPGLGDIGTLDFSRMAEAVAMGEAAAETSLANHPLRNRSTADDRPAARFADRVAAARAPSRLARVSVAGDTLMPAQQLVDRFALLPGDAITDTRLQAAMTRVYGLDYFSVVDYRRVRGVDGEEIVLLPERRDEGPDYLQFGLGLYNDFEGINRFSLGASLTLTELNRLTGQLNVQARIGSTQRIAGEFFQPLTGAAHVFVAPRVLHERRSLDIYAGANPVARITARADEAGVDFGWAERHGEWRLGYARGQRRLSVLIGPPGLSTYATDVGFARMSVDYDKLDRRDFPTHGRKVEWLAEHGETSLGSDGDFDRLRLRARLATSIDRQHLLVDIGTETVDGHGRVALAPAQLGGPFELAAFGYGELTGEQAAMLRVSTYRQVNRLPWLRLFAGGALEYGGAWNGSPGDLRERDAWPVATAFTGLTTPIGPLVFAVGVSEHDRRAVHIQLGERF